MTLFPPSTYAQCSTCGRRCLAVVTHSVRVSDRWVQWSSCFACNAADEARWNEQRADEDRVRLASAARADEAAKRDAQRVERQRTREAQT